MQTGTIPSYEMDDEDPRASAVPGVVWRLVEDTVGIPTFENDGVGPGALEGARSRLLGDSTRGPLMTRGGRRRKGTRSVGGDVAVAKTSHARAVATSGAIAAQSVPLEMLRRTAAEATSLEHAPPSGVDLEAAESRVEIDDFERRLAERQKRKERIGGVRGLGWSEEAKALQKAASALQARDGGVGAAATLGDRDMLRKTFVTLRLPNLGLKRVGPSFRSFTNLKYLTLSGNCFANGLMHCLPASLVGLHCYNAQLPTLQTTQLPNLVHLGLGYNDIDDEQLLKMLGIQHLEEGGGGGRGEEEGGDSHHLMSPFFPSLRVLDLSFNAVTKVEAVEKAVRSVATHLQHVWFEGNPVSLCKGYRPAVVRAAGALLDTVDDVAVTAGYLAEVEEAEHGEEGRHGDGHVKTQSHHSPPSTHPTLSLSLTSLHNLPTPFLSRSCESTTLFTRIILPSATPPPLPTPLPASSRPPTSTPYELQQSSKGIAVVSKVSGVGEGAGDGEGGDGGDEGGGGVGGEVGAGEWSGELVVREVEVLPTVGFRNALWTEGFAVEVWEGKVELSEEELAKKKAEEAAAAEAAAKEKKGGKGKGKGKDKGGKGKEKEKEKEKEGEGEEGVEGGGEEVVKKDMVLTRLAKAKVQGRGLLKGCDAPVTTTSMPDLEFTTIELPSGVLETLEKEALDLAEKEQRRIWKQELDAAAAAAGAGEGEDGGGKKGAKKDKKGGKKGGKKGASDQPDPEEDPLPEDKALAAKEDAKERQVQLREEKIRDARITASISISIRHFGKDEEGGEEEVEEEGEGEGEGEKK